MLSFVLFLLIRLLSILYIMDVEELLSADVLVSIDTHTSTSVNENRDKLSELISGGQSKRYFGKVVSIIQLEAMSNEEIEKLYAMYEAKLGAAMANSIKTYLLKGYVLLSGQAILRALPGYSLNSEQLASDLEQDPFIDQQLRSICCKLHHKLNGYIAPIAALIATAANVEHEDILYRRHIRSLSEWCKAQGH